MWNIGVRWTIYPDSICRMKIDWSGGGWEMRSDVVSCVGWIHIIRVIEVHTAIDEAAD